MKKSIIFAAILYCITSQSMAAQTKSVVNIDQWKTNNGAKVLYVNIPELPMVDISIVFSAGSARDSEKFGIANLTNSLLEEGTDNQSADEIAENFEKVGAIFSLGTSLDKASINLRSLNDDKFLQPALSNMADIITYANFPERNFKRVKNEILTQIDNQKSSPATIASNAFYKLVYGNHPYGHPLIGNEHTIKQIKITDVKNFYKQYYVANNAIIGIVGNVNKEMAKNIADQLVGHLPAGSQAKALAAPKYQPTTMQKHIAYPATQTYIRIGEFGTKYDNPYKFPLLVGNYILGGAPLNSRLFKQVREEKGLSYNVSSRFLPMQETGPFLISLLTRNDHAKQAIDVSYHVIDNFLRTGPSEEEVENAKKGIIDNFPTLLQSNMDILNTVMNIGFYQLPLDYLDTYGEKVSKVTREEIIQAFKTIVRPKQLVTVTVGPEKETKKSSNKQGQALAENQMIPVSW